MSHIRRNLFFLPTKMTQMFVSLSYCRRAVSELIQFGHYAVEQLAVSKRHCAFLPPDVAALQLAQLTEGGPTIESLGMLTSSPNLMASCGTISLVTVAMLVSSVYLYKSQARLRNDWADQYKPFRDLHDLNSMVETEPPSVAGALRLFVDAFGFRKAHRTTVFSGTITSDESGRPVMIDGITPNLSSAGESATYMVE